MGACLTHFGQVLEHFLNEKTFSSSYNCRFLRLSSHFYFPPTLSTIRKVKCAMMRCTQMTQDELNALREVYFSFCSVNILSVLLTLFELCYVSGEDGKFLMLLLHKKKLSYTICVNLIFQLFILVLI